MVRSIFLRAGKINWNHLACPLEYWSLRDEPSSDRSISGGAVNRGASFFSPCQMQAVAQIRRKIQSHKKRFIVPRPPGNGNVTSALASKAHCSFVYRLRRGIAISSAQILTEGSFRRFAGFACAG